MAITYSQTTATTNATVDYVWKTWASDSTSTCTSATTWNTWTTYQETSTTGDSWTVWTSGEPIGIQKYVPYYDVVREPTEEEKKCHEENRRRMDELAEQRHRENQEAMRKTKEAEEKALVLLRENLTEDQKAVFDVSGYIPVLCASGTRYRIRKGISGNVDEVDEAGTRKRRLCFHPSGVPIYDVMLCQKLMLEAAEERVKQIANYS